MVILIPFLLLRLKKVMEKERTPENLEALNEMTDESLILDIDIIDMAHEKEMKKLEEKLTEKDNVIAAQERELALLRKQLSELQK